MTMGRWKIAKWLDGQKQVQNENALWASNVENIG